MNAWMNKKLLIFKMINKTKKVRQVQWINEMGRKTNS